MSNQEGFYYKHFTIQSKEKRKEQNILEYTDKNYAAKGRGLRQMLTGLTKGGGEVGEMLIMADEGGWGILDPPIFG